MSTSSGDFRSLGDAEELGEGAVIPFYLDDKKHRVSVARIDGQLYAFDDLCCGEHPLSAGLLTGTTIMCQCDGSQYDVTTGAVQRGPATAPLGVYAAREADGRIEVRI